MPYRKIPLRGGEIYHVFNRSIAKQPIFLTKRDFQRSVNVINFYRFKKPKLRFSFFNRLQKGEKESFLEDLLTNGEKLLEILAYCIMPNHVHFLLQPVGDQSTSDFMRNFQHSYSKYFNTKTQRTGSLFQSMFKAIRIESDEQLLHVSRYIHLNPATSYLVKIESLLEYPWSSFQDYLRENSSMVTRDKILDYFRSREDYKRFVLDQANYQRELEKIKHLTLE